MFIVLMEFGPDPETGTCGYYFTAFDREVLRVESEWCLILLSQFQIIVMHKTQLEMCVGETFE